MKPVAGRGPCLAIPRFRATGGNGDGMAAEQLQDGSTPEAAVPRHAASLLLLRGGTHVLMGMRGAGHRFMPNRLVFPGGGVDPDDAGAPAAREPRPDTLALLGRGAEPPLARALTVAAARELEEETGLSLGTPPALDGLDYLCRAVTPPQQPIRFNARFLVADAALAQGSLAGSGELTDLRWYAVEEALALDLAVVTRAVLGQLTGWLAMPEPARRAPRAVQVFIERHWQEDGPPEPSFPLP